jgi:hypothetical protein
MWWCIIQSLFPKDLKDRGAYIFVDQGVKEEYRYASLSNGDMFWEMCRHVISLLSERHRVYLHKTR